MAWVYYLLLLVLSLGSLVLVAATLPGLWLMAVCAMAYALLTHEKYLGVHGFIALFVLAFLAELIELFTGGAATQRAGGGKRAVIGALIGGILGGIFLSFIPIPIISTIVGICLGTFLGAAAFEILGGEEVNHSVRVGLGAAKGRLMGIATKLAFGIAMFLFVLFDALPIRWR